MNKGKTNYSFQLNCDLNLVNKIVLEWLNINNFKVENKYGEEAYYYHDAFNGNRGFQYNINGNILNINAWTIGIGNVFYMLDSGAINNMAGDSYKNSLNTLFNKLNELNNSNVQNNNMVIQNQTINNTNAQNISQFTESFKEDNENKKAKMCEIGFWISLLGLLASFAGVTYGLIVYIMVFYFASQGLKTKKRKKALASIIITIISILILIMQIANM